MIIAKIVLWTLTVVQIGMLIFVVSLGVRMFLAERRRKMQESVDRAVARWSEEVKTSAAINPPPPSYSTNYLLQEGFLVVYRKPNQRVVLTASKDNEMLLTNFRLGHDHGTPIIINELTHETTPVTDAFIGRWSVNGA